MYPLDAALHKSETLDPEANEIGHLESDLEIFQEYIIHGEIFGYL